MNKSTTTTYHIEINGGPVEVSRIMADGKPDVFEVDEWRMTIDEARALLEALGGLLYGDREPEPAKRAALVLAVGDVIDGTQPVVEGALMMLPAGTTVQNSNLSLYRKELAGWRHGGAGAVGPGTVASFAPLTIVGLPSADDGDPRPVPEPIPWPPRPYPGPTPYLEGA